MLAAGLSQCEHEVKGRSLFGARAGGNGLLVVDDRLAPEVIRLNRAVPQHSFPEDSNSLRTLVVNQDLIEFDIVDVDREIDPIYARCFETTSVVSTYDSAKNIVHVLEVCPSKLGRVAFDTNSSVLAIGIEGSDLDKYPDMFADGDEEILEIAVATAALHRDRIWSGPTYLRTQRLS